jgi:hypothetical protein
MVLGNQPTKKPTRKVTSATVFGSLAAILTWADDKFWGDQIPGWVEAAIITVVIAVAGYFTRNASPDAPPEPVMVPEDEVGD